MRRMQFIEEELEHVHHGLAAGPRTEAPGCGSHKSPMHRLTSDESDLYNDLRDNRIRAGLRLEQEHISFHWLADRLQQLLDGTAASHSDILL